MKTQDYNIVVFGAGAIGATIAAWLHQVHPNTYILARNKTLDALRTKGLTTFSTGKPSETHHIKTLETLTDLPRVDAVVLCVKNYSLENVARQIKNQTGDNTTIVAIQNGLANQTILPNHFSKIIYGIAQYNAWKEDLSTVGYNRKKTLILDKSQKHNIPDFDQLISIFSQAMPTLATDRFNDAAHSKLIANLTNSLLSLSGKPETAEQLKALHKLFIKVMAESLKAIEAAGYRQFPMEDIPSWKILKLMTVMPAFLSRGRLRKGLKEATLTSMQQDLMQGTGLSELDTINGYLLKLAEKNSVPAPYSQALFDICQDHFRNNPAKPMSHTTALKLIESRINRQKTDQKPADLNPED